MRAATNDEKDFVVRASKKWILKKVKFELAEFFFVNVSSAFQKCNLFVKMLSGAAVSGQDSNPWQKIVIEAYIELVQEYSHHKNTKPTIFSRGI